ncbi:MAG TPA: ImmA/IrrE family metallo-endopeptidase [Chloroflexia bacterium]|nr:ImmA/IrrE family metallo-endopeptidase [Chloroflexia bacterium]
MDTITSSLHPLADYSWVVQVAYKLIKTYKLHHQPGEMIDITPLLAYFDLREMDLPEHIYVFTLDLESAEHKIIIALNSTLDTCQSRFVAAHELRHVALWHPNQFNQCVMGQALFNQLEKEATALAAYLLLPRQTVAFGLTGANNEILLDKIADWYKMPPQLVLVRRALYALPVTDLAPHRPI